MPEKCEKELPLCVECSIEKALEVLDGKWTFLILRELFEGTRRFWRAQKIPVRSQPQNLDRTAETP